jgi:hypothetical protein
MQATVTGLSKGSLIFPLVARLRLLMIQRQALFLHMVQDKEASRHVAEDHHRAIEGQSSFDGGVDQTTAAHLHHPLARIFLLHGNLLETDVTKGIQGGIIAHVVAPSNQYSNYAFP